MEYVSDILFGDYLSLNLWYDIPICCKLLFVHPQAPPTKFWHFFHFFLPKWWPKYDIYLHKQKKAQCHITVYVIRNISWKFQLCILFQCWEIFDAVFKNSKSEKTQFKKNVYIFLRETRYKIVCNANKLFQVHIINKKKKKKNVFYGNRFFNHYTDHIQFQSLV